ncbi:MAG: hypothetical protein V1798_08655 [Pseudomonadota bacterium]
MKSKTKRAATLSLKGLIPGVCLLLIPVATAGEKKPPEKTPIRAELSDDPSVVIRTGGGVIDGSAAKGGKPVSMAEAQSLEAKLKTSPNDLKARTALVRYYAARMTLPEENESVDILKMDKEVFGKKIQALMEKKNQLMEREKDSMRRLKGHIYWFIDHQPMSTFATEPLRIKFDLYHDNDFWVGATNRWTAQVQKRPRKAVLLAAAAIFFKTKERDRAEDLLRDAEKLEPKNPKWARKMAEFYMSGQAAWIMNTAKRRADLEAALGEYQQWLRLSDPQIQPWHRPKIAALAFEAGVTILAKQEAQKMLETSPEDEALRQDYIHYGNTILGRIALQEGDRVKAKEYLLKSVSATGMKFKGAMRRPGSDWELRHPSMNLAKDFLEKNERDTVVAYLEALKPIWSMDPKLQEERIAKARAGDVQQFWSSASLDTF